MGFNPAFLKIPNCLIYLINVSPIIANYIIIVVLIITTSQLSYSTNKFVVNMHVTMLYAKPYYYIHLITIMVIPLNFHPRTTCQYVILVTNNLEAAMEFITSEHFAKNGKYCLI